MPFLVQLLAGSALTFGLQFLNRGCLVINWCTMRRRAVKISQSTERAMRCRSNAVTITLFMAPQALLMQVPLIGPLVYVPMQFAAAWLLNMLLTDVPTRPPVAAPVPGSQVSIPAFRYHIQSN